MTKTFISYSRKDKEFVAKLDAALAGRGRQNWVDWKDIPPTALWRNEVSAGVEGSDAVIFVISPDSIVSVECDKELKYAVECHKRLVPLVHRMVDPKDVTDSISSLNWIYFTDPDQFEQSLDVLINALDTDLDWTRLHTKLLTKALEWERNQRDLNLALRGVELERAERWLEGEEKGKIPQPTLLQRQFVLASRRDALKRQRIAYGITAYGLIALIGLMTSFILYQHRANQLKQATYFEDRAVTALSENDATTAELLFAKTLTLKPSEAIREHILEARARSASLLWANNPADGSTKVLAIGGSGRWIVTEASHTSAPSQGDGASSAFATSHGDDDMLTVWDSTTHRRLLRIPLPADSAICADVSPGGDRLAIGNADGTITLVSLTAASHASVTLSGHSDQVTCVAFSQDGKMLASSGRDGTALIWNLATNEIAHKLIGHTQQVAAIAFSDDSKRVATASWDNDLRLWDVETGKLLGVLSGHRDAVLSVAFSHDGRLLASGSWDSRILVWDLTKLGPNGVTTPPRAFVGHRGGIWRLCFSPDDQILGSGGDDGTARIWDVKRGQVLLSWASDADKIDSLALTADGHFVTGADNGAVRIWDIRNIGEQRELCTLRGHTAPVSAVCFGPSRNVLASAGWDQQVRLWDVDHKATIASAAMASEITCLAFSRQDETIVAGGKDGAATLLRMKNGRLTSAGQFKLSGPSAVVRAVAFRPVGGTLAVGGDDGVIRIWDLARQTVIHEFHADRHSRIFAIAFSPYGDKLAAGEQSGRIEIWNIRTGKRLANCIGHRAAVWGVGFSHDGTQVVSGSEDGTCRLWQVSTGRQLRIFTGHKGPIWSVAYSPDDRYIASAGQDSTVRLWNPKNGRNITLAGEGAFWWVDFSPHGRRLAAGCSDCTARVWDIGAIEKLLSERPQALLDETEDETGLTLDGDSVVPRNWQSTLQ
jgi:WD40 repeat protein